MNRNTTAFDITKVKFYFSKQDPFYEIMKPFLTES